MEELHALYFSFDSYQFQIIARLMNVDIQDSLNWQILRQDRLRKAYQANKQKSNAYYKYKTYWDRLQRRTRSRLQQQVTFEMFQRWISIAIQENKHV